MTDFHISLEAARVNAKLTQKQAANELGISTNTLINWESEKTNPSRLQLERMSELYNTPLKYLLKEVLTVGGKSFSEITVTKDDGELIASIDGNNIIEVDGYKVICVPDETLV